ncbi:MAG TPA: TetR/AcrR family transcriptional regulator [Myxococcota bacterium]|nr:TetR/AcrR family transcriptional regulator [Myxococcota bacterium]
MVGALLDATENVLRSHGYPGASTNRVARAARVSVGSLYQYFGDKDGLIGAALERALGREAERLAEIAEQARSLPLEEGVARVVDAAVRSRNEQRALLAVLAEHGARFGPGTAAQQLARLQRGHADPLHRLVSARRTELRETGVETLSFASAALLDTTTFAYAVCAPTTVRPGALVDVLAESIAAHLVAAPPEAAPAPEVASIEVARVRELLADSCRSASARAALLDELVADELSALAALRASGAPLPALCEGMLRFWAQSARELLRAAGASAASGAALESEGWVARADRRARRIRAWLAEAQGPLAEGAGDAAVFVLTHAFLDLGLLFAQAREPAEIVDARIADAGALLAHCARLARPDASAAASRASSGALTSSARPE